MFNSSEISFDKIIWVIRELYTCIKQMFILYIGDNNNYNGVQTQFWKVKRTNQLLLSNILTTFDTSHQDQWPDNLTADR
jgi:hypothetical protein